MAYISTTYPSRVQRKKECQNVHLGIDNTKWIFCGIKHAHDIQSNVKPFKAHAKMEHIPIDYQENVR